MGGVATPLIERNTQLPCERTKIFSTSADNQTNVEINVLQGERPMAEQNLSLGLFRIDGIEPSKRGIPQIQVTFSVDINGILNISVKNLGTGKKRPINVNIKHTFEDDVSRMKNKSMKKFEKEYQDYAF